MTVGRRIRATSSLRTPPALALRILRSQAADVFGARERDDRHRFRAAVVVPLGPDAAVEHVVDITVGVLRPETDATTLPVRWTPVAHDRTLPAFEGALHVHQQRGKGPEVTIDGTYHPPLGVVGRVGDAVVGQRVARAAVHDLVQRVGRGIDEAARERADRMPTSPTPRNVDLRSWSDIHPSPRVP